jgi:hypothetical protein
MNNPASLPEIEQEEKSLLPYNPFSHALRANAGPRRIGALRAICMLLAAERGGPAVSIERIC